MEILIIIIIIIILVNILIEGFVYIINYFDWKSQIKEDGPRFTFEQFETFYYVAPEKWILKDYYATYDAGNNYIFIEFKNYSSYRKYDKWYKKLVKSRADEERLRKEKIVLEKVHEDIKKIAEKNGVTL